jgi:hypothetical protein
MTQPNPIVSEGAEHEHLFKGLEGHEWCRECGLSLKEYEQTELPDLDEIFEKLNGSGAHACYCNRSTDNGCECALKDEYLVEAKAVVESLLNKARLDYGRVLAELIFIDITAGHKVTELTKVNAKHDPKCSSTQGFMCDCEIMTAAQYAVDNAKERLKARLKSKGSETN